MINPIIALLLTLGFSYLLGSIPFGLLLTKLAGEGDIRAIGSGNIGATNVLRTGRKGLALLTLLLDGGKGAAAVLLAQHFHPGFGIVAGLAAFLGHIFPIWLKGKGGKGVATAIGALAALSWPLGLFVIATWLVTAYLFRYSSLAALIAFGLLPLNVILFARIDLLWFGLALASLIYIKHLGNIRRLVDGKETRIGADKSKA